MTAPAPLDMHTAHEVVAQVAAFALDGAAREVHGDEYRVSRVRIVRADHPAGWPVGVHVTVEDDTRGESVVARLTIAATPVGGTLR